jgi:hypothetical protein
LARQTFHAFKPFVNVYQCGRWHQRFDRTKSGPIFMITQEQWRLFHAHYQGQRTPGFSPKHVQANYLGPRHVQAMLEGSKYYYTGGNQGLAMCMVDIDAHEPWQDDLDRTCEYVTDLLGNVRHMALTAPSARAATLAEPPSSAARGAGAP